MPLTPCPTIGAFITYLNPDALHPVAVLRGVALGGRSGRPFHVDAWTRANLHPSA